MPPKPDTTIKAAVIAGVFLLLGTAVTAILTPAGPIIVGWFSGNNKVPQKPIETSLLSDTSLIAEGCSVPRNGQCLACEKPITFSDNNAGIVIGRVACTHMPNNYDVRAVFDGYVVTNHPQIPGNSFNTDVHLSLAFAGLPRDWQEHIHLVGGWTPFRLESRKQAPQDKAVEAELILVTCQSGSTPDSCSTYSHPATLRIEVAPVSAAP